jgi:hypothetical protein
VCTPLTLTAFTPHQPDATSSRSSSSSRARALRVAGSSRSAAGSTVRSMRRRAGGFAVGTTRAQAAGALERRREPDHGRRVAPHPVVQRAGRLCERAPVRAGGSVVSQPEAQVAQRVGRVAHGEDGDDRSCHGAPATIAVTARSREPVALHRVAHACAARGCVGEALLTNVVSRSPPVDIETKWMRLRQPRRRAHTPRPPLDRGA